MFRILRKLRRDERGQALVIGAVAMLVLAVSIMASVSIGHGVYEKIKLQDAADAQAYSIAVKEARAYNFLAYTNRAMIVHYSAMLTVMSYVSHAVYLDQTVANIASILQAIPGIGAFFTAVKQAIEAWKTAVETVSQVLIPALTALNLALWAAQESMLLATLADLITDSTTDAVTKTDPRARVGLATSGSRQNIVLGVNTVWGLNATTNYSNLKNFLHAIDDGPTSGGNVDPDDPTGARRREPLRNSNNLSDPNMAKYRLLMGNLANSVRRRWTAVGEGPFLIGRRWNFNLCLVLGQVRIEKTADSQIKNFDENFENNRKDQLFASDDIRVRVRPTCFFFGWNDVFRLRFRAAADMRGGFHQELGQNKSDDHHPWWGITPFITSDTSFNRPWEYHFSYPCNVVVLSKDMGADGTPPPATQSVPFQMGNLRKGDSSGFMTSSASNRFVNDPEREIVQSGFLDMTWKYVGGMRMQDGQADADAAYFRNSTGGMMAMAVGRAVYHRPGDWKEEPNFFNPLWTARLAPVTTHWEGNHMSAMIREWQLTQDWLNTLNY
jgi:Flp pilus assembly protein TadG